MTTAPNKSGQRRSDSVQLVRQWALLRLLADVTEPYGVKQLAEQLGTSKATIERDLTTPGPRLRVDRGDSGQREAALSHRADDPGALQRVAGRTVRSSTNTFERPGGDCPVGAELWPAGGAYSSAGLALRTACERRCNGQAR